MVMTANHIQLIYPMRARHWSPSGPKPKHDFAKGGAIGCYNPVSFGHLSDWLALSHIRELTESVKPFNF